MTTGVTYKPNHFQTLITVYQSGQPLTTYTTLPTSPLSQLPQGVVLTDDLMTFTTNLDPATLQGSTIQMVCSLGSDSEE